ncbi:MAG: hypothetical protein ACE5JO_12430, partial [Candidatus Binatia bacterium]
NFGRLSDLTTQERMALIAYQDFLARYPDSQMKEEAQQQVARILRKKRKHDYAQALKRGKADLAAGDLAEAAEILKDAIELDPSSEEATRLLEEIRQQQLRLDAAKALSLTVNEVLSPTAPQEKEAYEGMLLSWYLKGPSAVLREGQKFLSHYPKSPLSDEVAYLMAMAREAQGSYDRSRLLLEDLAREKPKANRGKSAQHALANPPYDLQEEIARAGRQQRRETLKYALLGEHPAQDNVAVGSSELAMEGLSALETLGIFNLMAMGYRTISTLIQNPGSHRKTIELGENYLSRFPDLTVSGELHQELARAYEKEGDLERALLHYEQTGKFTEKEKARYREKIAQGFFRYAQEKGEKERGKAGQRFYLELLLRNYPETQAAQKAMPEMVKLLREEDGLLRISKKELKENPAFFGANGINIKPELLDGKQKNHEIAEPGIAFITQNLLKITYETENGPKEQLYRVNEEIFKRLQIIRFQERYRTALTRQGDLKAQEDRKLLYEVGGDLSPEDVDLEAKLFRGNTGFFLGGDSDNPYGGFQFPLPVLDQVIPLNLKLSIRPSGVTLDPAVQRQNPPRDKAPLYEE